MRLERFTPKEQKPIGAGKAKEVFINPADQEKVVAVMQESTFSLSSKSSPDKPLPSLEIKGEALDAYSPRQLKGAFYLTKIAHMLLPQNIPEMHQVGEAVDGQQTIGRERVAHTVGQAKYQEQRAAGKATRGAENKMFNEMSAQKSALESELKRVGLDVGPASPLSNYSKDTPRVTSYLPEFRPWRYTYEKSAVIQISFDEEALRKAISELPDAQERARCETFLERTLTLFAEEQKEELGKEEQERHAESSDSWNAYAWLDYEFRSAEAGIDIDALFLIQTEEEAVKSAPREALRVHYLPRVLRLLETLNKVNLPPEISSELEEKYRRLSRAVGACRGGVVDHTR